MPLVERAVAIVCDCGQPVSGYGLVAASCRSCNAVWLVQVSRVDLASGELLEASCAPGGALTVKVPPGLEPYDGPFTVAVRIRPPAPGAVPAP